jgi:YcaO-like protein with predicted kinase domain
MGPSALLSTLFERPWPKCAGAPATRVESSEASFERVRPHMASMGITRIANITGLDRIGIPVVVACRPNSRSLSVSQGKGLTLADARMSALMESVESYHAERMECPLRLASTEELRRRERVVDVDRLPRATASVYHPRQQLLWVEGIDLFTGKCVWIPYELVHTNYTLPRVTGHGCFNASSNGLASGNALVEAVIHGLCEVIERDATTLWYLLTESERAATRINLNTVTDDACRACIKLLDDARVELAIWESTSDVGVPAFICLIVDRKEGPYARMHSAAGMGCHPCAGVALTRAVTEAVQSRLTVIAGSRDDIFRDDFTMARDRHRLDTDLDVLLRDGGRRAFSDVTEYRASTFNDELRWLLKRLREANIDEALLVRLSLPGVPVEVARMVVPGLESLSSLPGYVAGARAVLRTPKAAT